MSTLGKVAYDGYLASTGGKSLISGDQLPEFEKLPEGIKAAWEAGALAVKAELKTQCTCASHKE